MNRRQYRAAGRRTLWHISAPACILLAGIFAPLLHADPPVTKNLPVLTRADQVRSLTAEEARNHYPVHLRGVVLSYAHRSIYHLFIHDGSAGLFVEGAQRIPLKTGQLVELTGSTNSGEFAPMVRLSKLQVIGESPLPDPKKAIFGELASGRDDGQWVKVKGVVRSAVVEKLDRTFDWPFIEVVTESGGRLIAWVGNYQGEQIQQLVDAEVSMTGVCVPIFNRKRQLANVRLAVPSLAFVKVDRPAPADPFAAAAHPIKTLMQFAPGEPHDHQLKVEGVVTHQVLGESLFIRDATQGLWIKTKQPGAAPPGTKVEAAGFPLPGEYAPIMEDAVFRSVGRENAPRPIPLDAVKALEGDYDGDLVQLEGELVEQFQTTRQQVFILRSDKTLFHASLDQSPDTNPVKVYSGSRLRLTGICLVQLENQRSPQSFRIIVRTPADVAVTREPPWVTTQRIRWGIGIVTPLLTAGLIWTVTLKRRVNAQTRIIRASIHREATMEERTRIAQEFHDTLEQALSAIRMQLEVVADNLNRSPEIARNNLELAQSMIRHSQSEARSSVWDLRARASETGSLDTALAELTSFATETLGVPVKLSVSGVARSLPTRVENHIFRVAQEAVTNAARHGSPSSISISLGYAAEGIRLAIDDDGCGFAPCQAVSSRGGHFGLLGMRERAGKVGGKLRITSENGRGARIELIVPAHQNLPAMAAT